jgi:hypothetical protein
MIYEASLAALCFYSIISALLGEVRKTARSTFHEPTVAV